MKRTTLFSISFLLLIGTSCVRSEYFLTSGDIQKTIYHGGIGGYQSSSSNGAGYSSSYSVGNVVKPLYIPKEALTALGINNVAAYINYCNSRKFSLATKVLATNVDADPSAIAYLEALHLLVKMKFGESIQKIKNNKAPSIEVDVAMLILDNEFELQKKSGLLNKKYFVTRYQSMIDEGNLSQEYIEIIESRIKYLQYIN